MGYRYRLLSSAILCIVAPVLLSAGACGPGATTPTNDLAAARARWARSAPAAYSYTIQRSCECVAESSGPVIVSARNGSVDSRVYAGTGVTVAAQYATTFPAVEGLFSIIESAIANGTKPMSVEYHPTLGYPTRIALGDPAVDAPLYSVTDFRPQ